MNQATQDLPGQQQLPGMSNDNGQAAPQQQQQPVEEAPLTFGLLRDFEKQPNADRYSADSHKIKLLTDYAWCRQLVPDLTFEAFLERYLPLADHDEENLKHPEEAIKQICPRAKSQAEKYDRPQWSAKEVVDIMVLYVDVCREADAQGADPMPIKDFLEACAPLYKSGELPGPEKPKAGTATKKAGPRPGQPAPADPTTGLVETNNPLRPTREGQRVIYERPTENSRQIKGVVEGIFTENGDRQYVNFRSDDGEVVEGANINHFTVVADEQPPAVPEPVESKKLWIPKNQMPGVNAALELTSAMGNVALGDSIYQWSQEFDAGLLAEVTVVNGESGPYVDAVLLNPENEDVVAEIDPRKSVMGEYRFETSDGVLMLEVCTRK